MGKKELGRTPIYFYMLLTHPKNESPPLLYAIRTLFQREMYNWAPFWGVGKFLGMKWYLCV